MTVAPSPALVVLERTLPEVLLESYSEPLSTLMWAWFSSDDAAVSGSLFTRTVTPTLPYERAAQSSRVHVTTLVSLS